MAVSVELGGDMMGGPESAGEGGRPTLGRFSGESWFEGGLQFVAEFTKKSLDGVSRNEFGGEFIVD